MRNRPAALIVSILLMGSLFGAVGTAAAVSTGEISGWVTDYDAIPSCGSPFPTEEFIMVDVFDASMNRFGPEFVTDKGWYSFSSLDPGDYKVRFRVFDDSVNLVGYWWAGTGATTHGGGNTYNVTAGISLGVNACISSYTGGTFQGTVSSSHSGFDPECARIHAYEAVSGVGIGLLIEPQASGAYVHQPNLPPGDYRAVAVPETISPGCTSPAEVTERWWKGAFGAGLGTTPTGSIAMSNANLFSTANVFTITAGGVRSGIDFDLIPIGTCDGRVPTIVGTSGDDIIVGTPLPDVIKTFAGHDEINSLDGRDRICAGGGNDLVDGGSGRDRILGGNGNDLLRGNSGKDVLRGGDGNDRIYGKGGDDKLRGNGGDDRIYGGSGTDQGWGGAGADVCNVNTEIRISC